MNYLMHLYLSDNDEEIMVGNFIADSVKGKKVNDYPGKIAKGILRHREIDHYSDHHPAVNESKNYFRSCYGKYAGVAIDIIFDHFFAADFLNYTGIILNDFSGDCYKILLKHWYIMPWEIKLFLPFLIKHKRLQSYARINGLGDALNIMSRRTSFPDKTTDALIILKQNYNFLQKQFERFFNDITNELNHRDSKE